jgi:hypothetical protein
MIAEGVLVDASHVRYDHRLAVSGEPLEYDAVIARKTRDIPESWIG